MPNDLTFAQLSAALPAGSVIDDSTHGILLKVSSISGDTIDELSDTGVVETLFKLVRAANAAQASINANEAPGSRLNAFPALVPSTPTIANDGTVKARITASVVAEMPVSINDAVGPQA